MPQVCGARYLIISSNIHMLDDRLQCRLLVQNKGGIIFIPNQALAHERVRLVLNKQPWLMHMAERERRPFAWMITITGRRLDRCEKLRRTARLPLR